jgi:phosphatidylglycerophosphatase A
MGKKLINFIATGFYISYIPNFFFKKKGKFRGCGFFGTVLAFIFWWVVPQKFLDFSIFSFIVILLSIIIANFSFEDDGEKDNPLIVIDEIAGYFFSFIFVEKNLKNAALLFIFFRIFDTLKPFPIKKLENIRHRGFSIVADDLIAGLYASIITFAITKIIML